MWTTYLRALFATVIGAGLFVYVFVLLVDPYDSVWFSPELEREPVSTNQRFSFPALARSGRFDSAVFGTSTTRLLRPSQLDAEFGAAFANLSLNSGTAYEQSALHGLFLRHHASPRTIIYGIDTVWCTVQDTYDRFTFRPFPPWLYDENRWNDVLYLFNFKAIEEAGQQFGFLVGLRQRRYGADGYTNFLPPQSDYDIAQARRHLYGSTEPPPPEALFPVGDQPDPTEIAGWSYATHDLMATMLTDAPAETQKILVFVPYHLSEFALVGPRRREMLAECKRRLTALAETFPNTVVLDFMIPSAITREDSRYWDKLHYNIATAAEFGAAIARGALNRRGEPDLFDYLGGTPGGT